jgi:hypothetical protein
VVIGGGEGYEGARRGAEQHGGGLSIAGAIIGRMELIAWGITTLVTAFIGSYLASYLKKKGENLATHEDIDKLVDQMKAVTAATKEIEGRITNDFWQQQRRWDLKREVVFEVMKRMGDLEAGSARLTAAFLLEKQNPDSNQARDARLKVAAEYNDAIKAFGVAKNMVTLTCGDDATRKLTMIQVEILRIDQMIKDTQDPSYVFGRLAEKMADVYDVFREHLGITVTPLSNASSAGQAPAPPIPE